MLAGHDQSTHSRIAATIRTPPLRRLVQSKGPVVIESDAWIGEGACIMPGVRIGRGAVIGANAVVTRDVAPHSIVAGTPARLIKQVDLEP